MDSHDGEHEPTAHEKHLLERGLREWGGSAHVTDHVARFLGFTSRDHMQQHVRDLAEAIATGRPLAQEDWATALACTELVFVNHRWGAGVDWSTVTGLGDADTIQMLRSIQRQLHRWQPSQGSSRT